MLSSNSPTQVQKVGQPLDHPKRSQHRVRSPPANPWPLPSHPRPGIRPAPAPARVTVWGALVVERRLPGPDPGLGCAALPETLQVVNGDGSTPRLPPPSRSRLVAWEGLPFVNAKAPSFCFIQIPQVLFRPNPPVFFGRNFRQGGHGTGLFFTANCFMDHVGPNGWPTAIQGSNTVKNTANGDENAFAAIIIIYFFIIIMFILFF